ncbi:MAG: outer membrane lipoprotein-sorting protein [Burkholderiales bacterium]|nr:outer membrane lipoprotein-sorting protein [Opitutaceae bacterium]
MEFDLRVLPRRGEERRIPGRLWGGRNREGPLSRLSLLTPATKATNAANEADEKNDSGDGGAVIGPGVESRILVQGGPRPAAWRWPAPDGASIIAVDDAALFAPLAGTNLSAFDLQMPFLFWTDFVYEGKTRLQERPVDTFLLYPPTSLSKHRPDLAGMRVYLDPQYHALVKAEQIGEGERVLKSFSLGGLVKIGERWIPRSFELRDETTRDKTRFVVTAAALNLDFAAAVFDPGALSSGLRPPAPLTRLAE